MARERNIQTRENGTEYVSVRRTKSFKIEGLGSMVLKHSEDVDLVQSDGLGQDKIVQQLLVQATGADVDQKWRDIAEAVNAGRIYSANVRASSQLTKQFNSIDAVQAFAQVAQTLGKSVEGTPSEIANKLLAMFPEMKEKLDAAGFVFSENEDEDEDEDE